MKGHPANTSESAHWSISCRVRVWNPGGHFRRPEKRRPLNQMNKDFAPVTKSNAPTLACDKKWRAAPAKWKVTCKHHQHLESAAKSCVQNFAENAWKHSYDAQMMRTNMIREWTHQSATRPVRKAYFSCCGKAYSIEKHSSSCTGHFSEKQSHVTDCCACHEKWCADIAKHCACQKSHTSTSPDIAPAAESDS